MNSTINKMRFFFMISVFYAHTWLTFPSNLELNKIIDILGSIGVPGFILISGYLFRQKKMSQLIIEKIKRLFIPMIICVSLIFVVMNLCYSITHISLFGGYNFYRFVSTIFGFRDIYYYCWLLLLLSILFNYNNDTKFLIICIIVTIMYSTLMMCSNFDVLDSLKHLQNINIIRYMGYFSLGILCKRYNFENTKISTSKTLFMTVGIIFMFYTYLLFSGTIQYIADGNIYKIMSIYLIYRVSRMVNVSNTISDKFYHYSFAIFLYHRFLYETTLYLHGGGITELLHPFIWIIIYFVLCDIAVYVFNWLNIEQYLPYFGITSKIKKERNLYE